jgi:putative glutamine amidotransferase
MRPLIGITTYVTQAHWGYWDLEAALIPQDYVNKVEEAGGRALLVPPALEGVDETLDALDGIILTGGSDLDPELYDEEAHPETFGIHRLRDDAELALLHGALERDMPLLGICRGIQVINVGLGGSLLQHVPDIVGHEGHKNDPPGEFLEHEVEVLPDTRLAEVLGERTHVQSHHHQGLKEIGEGLREAARAEDGLVEAIEAPDKRFAIGVLWHPEADENGALFAAFVEEAQRYADERVGTR